MKILLAVNNQVRCGVTEQKVRAVLVETLKKSGLLFLKKKTIEVSVALVAGAEIKKLNRTYRKVNAVTDVLSFNNYRTAAALEKEKKSRLFLGEIILCCSDIRKSAKIEKNSFEREFNFILSHGVLHLLGFRHGEKMFSLQEKVSTKITKKNERTGK